MNKSAVNDRVRSIGVDGSMRLNQKSVARPWNALFADNRIREKSKELIFISPSVSNGQRVVQFHSNKVV